MEKPIEPIPPSRPKVPHNGYTIYSMKRMKQIEGMSIRDKIIKIATEWHDLGSEKKDIYITLAAPTRVRYEQEMEIYKPLLTLYEQQMELYEQQMELYNRQLVLNKLLAKLQATGRSDELCPICLNKLNEPSSLIDSNEVNIVKLNCDEQAKDKGEPSNFRHKFHKECILEIAFRQNIRDDNDNILIKCPQCSRKSFGTRRSKKRSKRSKKRSKRSKKRSKKLSV